MGLRNHEQTTVSFAHVEQYLGLMEHQKLGELLLLGLQEDPVRQSHHQIHSLHYVGSQHLLLQLPHVSPLEEEVLNH
jgi:hypothetical protein